MITSVTAILVEHFLFRNQVCNKSVRNSVSLNRRDWQRRIRSHLYLRASEHLLLYIQTRKRQHVFPVLSLDWSSRAVAFFSGRSGECVHQMLTRPRVAKTHAYVTVRATRASIGRLRYT